MDVRRRLATSAAMALALGAAVPALSEPPSGNGFKETVIPLGALPTERRYGTWLAISPDKTRLAFVADRGDKEVVVLDGKDGGLFDRIDTGDSNGKSGGLIFSADSKHLAYFGERDGAWWAVVDREVGPGFEMVRDLGFTADGTAFYLGKRGADWHLVLGERQAPLEKGALLALVRVLPDGRVVFARKTDDQTRLVVDGKEGEPYEGIAAPGYRPGPGGRRGWFVAAAPGGRRFVVVDGEPEPPFDSVGALSFSANELRAAHYARSGDKWLVVVDGEAGPLYDNVLQSGVKLAENGARVGYGAKRGKDWHVVINGVESPAYAGVALGSPVFSPDSRRHAYVASRDGKAFAVIDGMEGPPGYRIPGNVVFSPDSRRAAYALRGEPVAGSKAGFAEQWRVVVDGVEGPSFSSVEEKRPPLFSPDSARLAYVAGKERKQVVVLDGRVLGAYDHIEPGSLVFSPDGRHLAWVGAKKGVSALIVDGRETASYFERLLAPDAVGWSGPNDLHALVADAPVGGRVSRVDIAIP
jgi:hypothetical protein